MAKVTIVNVETGEVIERDETQEETNHRVELAKINEKMISEKKAKIEAVFIKRKAIFDKLGITEEEAKLLLS